MHEEDQLWEKGRPQKAKEQQHEAGLGKALQVEQWSWGLQSHRLRPASRLPSTACVSKMIVDPL